MRDAVPEASHDARRILDQIRAQGERITTPRRAVIELLASTHEHLTVDDIASRLHPVHPSIAPSTVYRTLEALQAWGMVEKIHRGQGATFFHLAQAHQHIVCDACGKVSDIPAHELDDLVATLRERYAFELQPSRFALLGRCSHHSATDGAVDVHGDIDVDVDTGDAIDVAELTSRAPDQERLARRARRHTGR